jgi:hypothetical protein
MTITMYDTTEPSLLPSDAQAVAGYIGPPSSSNRYVDFGEIAHRFYGHAHCLSIAAQAFLIAACLDVETGDANPGQAPGFYANLSTMPALIGALRGAQIPRSEYRLWVADWDGVAELPAGYDAKQYTDHGPHGENYDISILRDDFFPKPKPKKLPKPHPKVIGASIGVVLGAGVTALLVAAGVHITPAEANAIALIGAAVTGTVTPNPKAR